ncbi:unnamed protein product, partial [Brassica oleracea var. botrytis]
SKPNSEEVPRRRPVLERLLSSQTAQTPYLYLNEDTVVVDTKLFESRKEETVIIPNQVES